MAEGSLEAPIRHPIPWNEPDFTDPASIDAELRRVFDICHGCRRCFNLCDSFPKLFDLIDEAPSLELDTVDSKDFKPVVDACTLCDMCYMTKCPYVPPHEFNLDFPHLMLRYRAAEFQKDGADFGTKQLTQTDRNASMARLAPGLCNWASKEGNSLTRPLMEKTLGVHRDAALPTFAAKSLSSQTKSKPPVRNTSAPAAARKALVFATCFAEHNRTETGTAALAILAQNGVDAELIYPMCCGMPQLEQGDIKNVADRACKVAAQLRPQVDAGLPIIALVPSCALMLKFEWPLIVPDDENVKALSAATKDISEYIVDIAKNEGLADGLKPLDGSVTVHIACHARAQNMGQKAAELLRLIPDIDLKVVERCSGHGGSWGIMKDNYEVGHKVGKPVARAAVKNAKEAAGKHYVVSECPLAGMHIAQGMGLIEAGARVEDAPHPVELFARAYGLA
jgi:glycerol-3-phosphate dehydrogenase subunit C